MTEESERTLSDRHLIAIARVITTWSTFERILRMIAFGLTTDAPIYEAEDTTAAIVYEGMQTRTLIGMFRR